MIYADAFSLSNMEYMESFLSDFSPFGYYKFSLNDGVKQTKHTNTINYCNANFMPSREENTQQQQLKPANKKADKRKQMSSVTWCVIRNARASTSSASDDLNRPRRSKTWRLRKL